MPDSTPERDRWLASQPRMSARHAAGIDREIDNWMRGPEARRLKRYRHIVDAIRAALGDQIAEKVKPIEVRKGTLTVSVPDAVLLSELKNHRYQDLVGQLVARGTGIGSVRFRTERTKA